MRNCVPAVEVARLLALVPAGGELAVQMGALGVVTWVRSLWMERVAVQCRHGAQLREEGPFLIFLGASGVEHRVDTRQVMRDAVGETRRRSAPQHKPEGCPGAARGGSRAFGSGFTHCAHAAAALDS